MVLKMTGALIIHACYLPWENVEFTPVNYNVILLAKTKVLLFPLAPNHIITTTDVAENALAYLVAADSCCIQS